MKIIGIIPARYASTRFPGKPLVDIKGKTMIRRVYEQAKKATQLADVIVATDDERIFKEVEGFGGKAVMTAETHTNGTERCAEVAAILDADVIINIQGDEPFIHPEPIDQLARSFANHDIQIATLIKEHPFNEDLQNPTRVKVVIDKHNNALYFSRHVIPFYRSPSADGHKHIYYKHIGIYAYRKHELIHLVALPPGALEQAESLEQLRWLENGHKIHCVPTTHESISIDVPEDLELVKGLI